jgi:hypothetical protein
MGGDSHLNLLVSVLDEKVTQYYGDKKIPKNRLPQIIHSPDDSELVLFFYPPEPNAKPDISLFERSAMDTVLKTVISCAELILEVNHPTGSSPEPLKSNSELQAQTAGGVHRMGALPKLWISKKIIQSFKGTKNWRELFDGLEKIKKGGEFARNYKQTGVIELTGASAGLSKSGHHYAYELKFLGGPLGTYRFLGNMSTWERKKKSGSVILERVIHFTEVIRK